jgi:predicted ester cyclase
VFGPVGRVTPVGADAKGGALSWYTLANPAIISVPLGFIGCWLATTRPASRSPGVATATATAASRGSALPSPACAALPLLTELAAVAVAAPPTEASNGELVRWAFEMLNQRQVEPLKEFWTDATVERFPDRTCRGAEEIAAYFEDAFAAIPDWHMEVIGMAEQGDDVFVQWHLTGTHEGPLLGIAPTGKPIAIDGIDHFVLRDGKVVSNFVVVDQMEYARQIGMLPADGSAGDKAFKAAFNARTKLAEKIKRS